MSRYDAFSYNLHVVFVFLIHSGVRGFEWCPYDHDEYGRNTMSCHHGCCSIKWGEVCCQEPDPPDAPNETALIACLIAASILSVIIALLMVYICISRRSSNERSAGQDMDVDYTGNISECSSSPQVFNVFATERYPQPPFHAQSMFDREENEEHPNLQSTYSCIQSQQNSPTYQDGTFITLQTNAGEHIERPRGQGAMTNNISCDDNQER